MNNILTILGPTVILIVIFILIAFLCFIKLQRWAIAQAKVNQFFTQLPRNGNWKIISRGNVIHEIIVNPPPGYVYDKERDILIVPNEIEKLRQNPQLKDTVDKLVKEYQTDPTNPDSRPPNFDYGVHWTTFQLFWKLIANVRFMGLEEFNVKDFTITVREHVKGSSNGTEEVTNTKACKIENVNQEIPFLFDHDTLSKGREIKGVGFGQKLSDTESIVGAYTVFFALNLNLLVRKLRFFASIAQKDAIDIAEKIDALLEAKLLQYSQQKTFEEIVGENKKDPVILQDGTTIDKSCFYSTIMSLNADIEVLFSNTNGSPTNEHVTDITGLSVYRYALSDFNIEQPAIQLAIRERDEAIAKGQAEVAKVEQNLIIAQKGEAVAKQEAKNEYITLQPELKYKTRSVAILNRVKHSEAYSVFKNEALPADLKAYADGVTTHGGIYALNEKEGDIFEKKPSNPIPNHRSKQRPDKSNSKKEEVTNQNS